MVTGYNSSGLSIENLSRGLEQNRNQVVKSLLACTISGAIDIDHEPGKTAWKRSFSIL